MHENSEFTTHSFLWSTSYKYQYKSTRLNNQNPSELICSIYQAVYPGNNLTNVGYRIQINLTKQ